MPGKRCAVCARPLAEYDYTDGHTEWRHGPYDVDHGVDHDPVPIDNTNDLDQVSICDFCDGTEVAYGFPCEDFGPSRGDWAACAQCKDDVLAGRYDEMLARFELNRGRELERSARTVLLMYWVGFNYHRKGDPYVAY